MPRDEARVSIEDPGFLYGEGVFETIRIHRGAPFRFDAHMARLRGGLRVLGIAPPAALEKVDYAARELLWRSSLAEGLLRITVTPGPAWKKPMGTVAMSVRALTDVPSEIRLHVAESVRRVPGQMAQCKTTSRAAEAIAGNEARRARAFDAILLNPKGNVVETTARNVFSVSHGILRTPPASEGALEGITRAVVLELAKGLGLRVDVEPIPLAVLREAEEVFLTGSGVGILGVHRVADLRFSPVPGPIAARIAEAYGQALEENSTW